MLTAPKVFISATSHALHIFGRRAPDENTNEQQPIVEFTATEVSESKQQPQVFKGKSYPIPVLKDAKKPDDEAPNYVVNFWPVSPGTRYLITIKVSAKNAAEKNNNNNDDEDSAKLSSAEQTKMYQLRTSTRPSPFKKEELILVTSTEIAENPGIMDLILSDKLTQDYLIMVEQDIHTNLIFLEKLFWNALFILPDDESCVSTLPNSKNRFSIDLEQQNIPWLESRKVKKYMKDFELCLTNNFAEILSIAEEIHEGIKGSTWIIPSFTESLQKLAKQNDNPNSVIQLYAFVLKEKPIKKNNDENEDAAAADANNAAENSSNDVSSPSSSGRIAAATFGFACGQNFHDYTMTTVLRDHRSAGTLVTKLAGYILQQAGFKFWYWGMQIGYMQDFVGKYGGGDFERKVFYDKWTKFREEKLEKPLGVAAAEICKRINLDFRYEAIS